MSWLLKKKQNSMSALIIVKLNSQVYIFIRLNKIEILKSQKVGL